jgi:hypothetical protein
MYPARQQVHMPAATRCAGQVFRQHGRADVTYLIGGNESSTGGQRNSQLLLAECDGHSCKEDSQILGGVVASSIQLGKGGDGGQVSSGVAGGAALGTLGHVHRAGANRGFSTCEHIEPRWIHLLSRCACQTQKEYEECHNDDNIKVICNAHCSLATTATATDGRHTRREREAFMWRHTCCLWLKQYNDCINHILYNTATTVITVKTKGQVAHLATLTAPGKQSTAGFGYYPHISCNACKSGVHLPAKADRHMASSRAAVMNFILLVAARMNCSERTITHRKMSQNHTRACQSKHRRRLGTSVMRLP